MGAGSSIQNASNPSSPVAQQDAPNSPSPGEEAASSPTTRLSRARHVSGFILPEDLLRKLLMRLGPAGYVPLAAVCRTWDFVGSGIGSSLTLRKSASEHLGLFTPATLQGCCTRFRLLRRLGFEDSRSVPSHTEQHRGDFSREVFDAMPGTLAACCPLLSHLKLSRCCIEDSQLHAVAEALPKLVSLALDRCPMITAGAVAEIPGLARVTMLALVCLGTLSNKSMAAIGAKASRVQHLDLSSCQSISARCFEGLTGVMSLSLTSCEWLHDRALESIARSCAGLLTLNLCHCDALTDQGVAAAAKLLRGLQSINLSWCAGVSGGAVRELCALEALQELFLEGCTRLTASDVLDVSASVVGVHTLGAISVARCPRVTDMAVAALGKRCKVLRQLDVSHCPKVTEAGIVDMMAHSGSLQCIVAKGVDVDLALLNKHVPKARRPHLVL